MLKSNRLSVFCLSETLEKEKGRMRFTEERDMDKGQGVTRASSGAKDGLAAKVTGGGDIGMASDLC